MTDAQRKALTERQEPVLLALTRADWDAIAALAYRVDEELDDAGCKDCPGCADCYHTRLATKRAHAVADRLAALFKDT